MNYKEISDKAFRLHQQNKFDEAELLYKKILDINPDDVNVLNLLGLLMLSKNKSSIAVEYLTKAYVLKKSSYIASNLGKAYYYNEEIDNAIKIYNQALEIEKSDDIYYSLALAHKKNNDFVNVVKCYKNAIEINPENYNAIYNLSLVCADIKDIDSAIFYAKKCLELKKDNEEIYSLLSGFYEDKNEYKNAIETLKLALKLNPQNYLYYYNLGVLYSRIKSIEEAIWSYKASISLNKKHIESYVNIASLYKNIDIQVALKYLEDAYSINNKEENLILLLAQVYRDLYHNEKSINVLNSLLNLNSNNPEVYSQLGINYMDLGDYQVALSYYQKALDINPMNKNYIHGKAVALKYLGNIAASKELLEKIVKDSDSSVQSKVTLGMMYLTEKEFIKGMNLYRERSKDSKFNEVFKEKIWNPNVNIDGKKILLYSDCGLGDTIMYVRYLNFLKDKVESLTLQTDKELVEILSLNFPDIKIISKGVNPPEYDYVMPIMDIQFALNLNFDNIPCSDSYLSINSNNELISSKKKIGLFWQGNKKVFKNRSISFKFLEKLLDVDNCEFYSFQIENNILSNDKVIKLSDRISNYTDTAILLKNLDLLITIDSSIVHMAGALGVKTFLLLPHVAEWRWFSDDKMTPWYNSVRIFRQIENNNWSEVIDRVKNELIEL